MAHDLEEAPRSGLAYLELAAHKLPPDQRVATHHDRGIAAAKSDAHHYGDHHYKHRELCRRTAAQVHPCALAGPFDHRSCFLIPSPVNEHCSLQHRHGQKKKRLWQERCRRRTGPTQPKGHEAKLGRHRGLLDLQKAQRVFHVRRDHLCRLWPHKVEVNLQNVVDVDEEEQQHDVTGPAGPHATPWLLPIPSTAAAARSCEAAQHALRIAVR
mmetsp:Transcript_67276/g.160454  ORF Transcript_67276/g.160454 Transcript_67276/m.160454 type:complete len:212 (+) Transcript_67276:2819-3454(+)